MQHKGYMLIEIMLVICLMTLVGGLVIGNMPYVHRMCARSALYTLYTACSYMQMRARATHQSQMLVFDLLHHTYSYHGNIEQLPSGVVFGVLEGAQGPPSSPTHVIAQPITYENQCITFTPHGIIQPGTVYIKTTDNMYMYALSAAVCQASFLRMYEYYQGAWRVLT